MITLETVNSRVLFKSKSKAIIHLLHLVFVVCFVQCICIGGIVISLFLITHAELLLENGRIAFYFLTACMFLFSIFFPISFAKDFSVTVRYIQGKN